MEIEQKNLAIVTSVINISSNPLSYTKQRSVFTSQERFEQTIKTLESMKKIPNVIILHVEGSIITPEWEKEIRKRADIFINIYAGGTDELRKKIDGKHKSIAESTMTYKGLQMVSLSLYKNIFKMSGRYWLGEKFVWEKWDNDDTLFRTSDGVLSTCFYKINKKDFDTWVSTIKVGMKDTSGLEQIYKREMRGYKILNEQGVNGYVSVDGNFVDF